MKKGIFINDVKKCNRVNNCPAFSYFNNYGKLLTIKHKIKEWGTLVTQKGNLRKFEHFACCYLFLDVNYKVLYVGKTINFYNRYFNHKNKKEKLYNAIFFVLVESPCIDDEEMLLIKYFTPPYNKRGNH